MLQTATKPLAPYSLAILRIIVGLTFFLMGLSKIENPSGFLNGKFFPPLFPGPLAVLGWLPVILEPIGGILLILGIGTRWLSLYFILEMLVTAFYVKAAHGVAFTGGGFGFDLLLLAGALVLLVAGPGSPSVEHDVLKREL